MWVARDTLNFKKLTVDELNTYFPKEKIIINYPKTEILKESKQIRDFIFNQNIFFYDQYGGQWVMNRINISKIYLIQLIYIPEKKLLKLKSDVYVMDELLLSLFDEYREMEMEDLKLADLVKIKNKISYYSLINPLPKHLEFSFMTYMKQDMIEWMNPGKYYLDEVSE